MKFIAQLDMALLGIKQGQVFEVQHDELCLDPANKIFKDPTLFREYIDPKDRIQKNDHVVIWGYWENTTHPSKPVNKAHKREPIKARVTDVVEKEPGYYYITVMADDGDSLRILTNTIKKEDLEKGVPACRAGFMCHISYKRLYWFVNSDGVVCSDIKDRKPAREKWLKKVGNYWPSLDITNQYHDHILYGSPFNN